MLFGCRPGMPWRATADCGVSAITRAKMPGRSGIWVRVSARGQEKIRLDISGTSISSFAIGLQRKAKGGKSWEDGIDDISAKASGRLDSLWQGEFAEDVSC